MNNLLPVSEAFSKIASSPAETEANQIPALLNRFTELILLNF